MNILKYLTISLLISLSAALKNNFRGNATSYGIHVEATGQSTKLRYDLPSARVQATPSRDWKVTNNNAYITSLLTPAFMTLHEIHPKFDMKGTWPNYKVKITKTQKAKKRLLRKKTMFQNLKIAKFKSRAKKIR